MDNDNISQQSDEIEVLKSIFEDQWEIDTETGTYSMQIDQNVKLFITLSPDYPSSAPPKYELLAPTLTSSQKDIIKTEFQRIYEEECGNPIIFQWIEKLKEIVSKPTPNENSLCDISLNALIVTNVDQTGQSSKREVMNVTHGLTIVDRKSVFQGHACAVKDEKNVKEFMNYLLENKKIAQATHNISAYRISLPNSVIVQDCNDDGEAHASGRILHLLQILKLTNVMVVVSRWYGGIHLGPDRFKHINNAARQVLLQGGFIKA
ncbi:protein IMPACT-like [Anoplophora glabripennis]|uniref:protein IMPACT-like n=1 Tax=Anoplophora glabripennis TaxID=217634 RepID=UPI0008740751|nr:protein IMPACT-like [Anoplophora glabripennis]